MVVGVTPPVFGHSPKRSCHDGRENGDRGRIDWDE